MSPELVQGGPPTVASDCWALGCTLHHALCGKPPLWAETQAETMRRVVRFGGIEAEAYPAAVPEAARTAVAALLQRDAAARLGGGEAGVAAVLSHPFFAELPAGSLYDQSPPPLAQGPTPPAPSAAWTRRQNSIMWSPLPQRYTFGEQDGPPLEPIGETEAEAATPFVPQLAAWREPT
uniref:Protein kinase domain-containing protein n=1 Tax=Emiliania huxleyi TaxID=2903 RepID=A0A6U8VYB7_EMIHU|mmetsp:Transcript_11458/g.36700  ORF Transcript_11458/g.36700 Transcript_11458/m.36700 type:complete len:178 (+) Transcript_11458:126-659(+)